MGSVTRKASVSHERALVQELREDPQFAAEYLKAALDDADEPAVLLLAISHVQKPTHDGGDT